MLESLIDPFGYLAILGLLAQDAPFAEVVAYQLTAVAVVIFSLTALWFLSEIISLWFRKSPFEKARGQVITKRRKEAATLSSEEEIRLIAVIAASVVAVCGPRAAIRSIVDATSKEPVNPNLVAWTLQGRLQHHGSHSVR